MSVTLDITPEQLALVRTILAAHVPADVEVLVFGSRAKGTAKRFSDLNLALKGSSALDQRILNSLADAFEQSELPWRVDLVDYHSLVPSFLAAVQADLRPLTIHSG